MILVRIFLTSILLHVPMSKCVLRRKQKLGEAIQFWTESLCTVPYTKTVNFHGVLTRRSYTLRDFFEALLQGIGDHCDAVMLSKLYTVNNLEKEKTLSLIVKNNTNIKNQLRQRNFDKIKTNVNHTTLRSLIWTEHFFMNPPVIRKGIKERRRYINVWNMHIIILEDRETFEKILDTENIFEWTPREHFIILAIWNENNLGDTVPIIERILRKLWTVHKIHNVFLNEPLSNQRANVMYSYNPFAKVNDTEWGQLESINVKSKRYMFYLLSTMTYRRTTNLNGRGLKVSLFEHYPTITKMDVKPAPGSIYEYSAGYNGTDAVLLGTIAKYMNFRLIIVEPEGYDKFGHQMKNGTFTGALADVVYGRAEMCVVPLFIKKYGRDMHLIEFTTHINFDKVCVVAPKALKIPKGFRIYHIFEASVWFFMMFSQLLFFLSWYYLKTFTPQRSEKVNCGRTFYETFLVNSGYPVRLPNSNAERILLSGVFISSITIMGTFNGALYKCFARDMYYKDINQLTELDASGLPIAFSSFSVSDLFGEGDDDATPLMISLRSKLIYGRNALRNAAYHRNVTGLLRKYSYPLLRETLSDKDGSHLLHLVKECPGQYYLSYLLPRNSILRERINVLIDRLNQGGFPTKWKRRTLHRRARKMKINIDDRHSHGHTEFVAFNLSDMQTSFLVLGLGLLLSTVVFFHEKGWFVMCLEKVMRKKKQSAN